MSEPRAWLYIGRHFSSIDGKDFYQMIDGPMLGPDKTWLVEKSAYDGMKADRDRLGEKIQGYLGNIHQLNIERDALRAELEQWKKKVEYMAEVHESQRYMIKAAEAEIERLKNDSNALAQINATNEQAAYKLKLTADFYRSKLLKIANSPYSKGHLTCQRIARQALGGSKDEC